MIQSPTLGAQFHWLSINSNYQNEKSGLYLIVFLASIVFDVFSCV